MSDSINNKALFTLLNLPDDDSIIIYIYANILSVVDR